MEIPKNGNCDHKLSEKFFFPSPAFPWGAIHTLNKAHLSNEKKTAGCLVYIVDDIWGCFLKSNMLSGVYAGVIVSADAKIYTSALRQFFSP